MANIRASRAGALADKIHRGRAIEAFIGRPENVKRMVAASQKGVQPVSAISGPLCQEFKRETFDDNPAARQFVGVVIRPLMEQEGFVVIKRNVPLRGDPLFKSGALYGRPGKMSSPKAPLLKRFVDALSAQELDWVASYVAKQRKIRAPDDATPDGERDDQ
jgi:hypothetical protein